MNLDDVKKIKVARSKRHRVGRGAGSGWGKTSGRGHKGAGQRSGTRFRLRFEGGQMPLYRRLPKKGFTNARFKLDMHVVNVGDLEEAYDSGAKVDLASLKAVGLLPKRASFVKVLGFGELSKSLVFECHGVSAGAKEKIEAANGSIALLPTATEMRERGVKKAIHTSGKSVSAPAAPKNETPEIQDQTDAPAPSDSGDEA
jgi:large subunit ribosomal protein L15